MVSDPTVAWPQALAWRLRRQALAPGAAEGSVADVVRLLGALPAEHAPDLATGIRRGDPQPGDVARALATGEVISTFAFRGATHLLTPSDGAAFLALRAASRMWELPSWQSYYRLSPLPSQYCRCSGVAGPYVPKYASTARMPPSSRAGTPAQRGLSSSA